MSKEAIARMLCDKKNAYYRRWHTAIEADMDAARNFVYVEWKEHQRIEEQKRLAAALVAAPIDELEQQELMQDIEAARHRECRIYINKVQREHITRQMHNVALNTPPAWDEITVHPRIEMGFLNVFEDSDLFDVSNHLSHAQQKRYEKVRMQV